MLLSLFLFLHLQIKRIKTSFLWHKLQGSSVGAVKTRHCYRCNETFNLNTLLWWAALWLSFLCTLCGFSLYYNNACSVKGVKSRADMITGKSLITKTVSLYQPVLFTGTSGTKQEACVCVCAVMSSPHLFIQALSNSLYIERGWLCGDSCLDRGHLASSNRHWYHYL